MKRGFYLSITAIIILVIIVGIVVSANRSGSFERELRVEADRAHAMTTTLLRLRSTEIPQAVSLALKESVVELSEDLTLSRLEQLARTGSFGSYTIDHPLALLEDRGSELGNDPVDISIVSFTITSIEPVSTKAFAISVTYDLEVSIDSERVKGNFTYSDIEEIVSIVGAEHPNHGSRITRTHYRQTASEECYLGAVGIVSDCEGQDGLEPKPS